MAQRRVDVGELHQAQAVAVIRCNVADLMHSLCSISKDVNKATEMAYQLFHRRIITTVSDAGQQPELTHTCSH